MNGRRKICHFLACPFPALSLQPLPLQSSEGSRAITPVVSDPGTTNIMGNNEDNDSVAELEDIVDPLDSEEAFVNNIVSSI